MSGNIGIYNKESRRVRIKKDFIDTGLKGFNEREILEMLLFFSFPRKETNKIADRLLKRFGTLANVLDASHIDLSEVEGMTENSCILMKFIPELAQRYLQSRWLGKIDLSSSLNASSYVLTFFCSLKKEIFYIICLDGAGNHISSKMIAEGTVNEAYIQPRAIVEHVIEFRASSVILAHNHPGGSLKPSKEDIRITNKIKTCLEPISVRVLDHIIACGKEYFSFAENRLL